MAQVTFGLFDWMDRGTAPLHQLYEERLQLLEAADAAGFVGYHLAEHHATPLGIAPSPPLLLTAAAQRTQRIRLGPLVYALPLYHPLRLIAHVCMLDRLSGRRPDHRIRRSVPAGRCVTLSARGPARAAPRPRAGAPSCARSCSPRVPPGATALPGAPAPAGTAAVTGSTARTGGVRGRSRGGSFLRPAMAA